MIKLPLGVVNRREEVEKQFIEYFPSDQEISQTLKVECGPPGADVLLRNNDALR